MSVARGEIDAICAAFPGAVLSGPGELDAWKVGGKMFACFGHEETRTENAAAVSVKCPDVETAEMLIGTGAAGKAAYFHRSWVSLSMPDLRPDEARHRLAVSYDKVRAGLPAATRGTLAPREGA
ncbi:putative DNA-binding protein (MmcQ/YjbR family) [Hasllibacter halocynthiae]|uniref:Putative DNA-binding protein (MmcQ/YjbR family) n=1 Tax=Hasllibacter halocynthiae TaxID=595589 RepID=A0A2T0X6P2_9RHOB|nr:MmcQ/YjbR family DNA-binding protein [Hasllibacter halocynthiae]PRY94593.1 putative DNA-binding protein (MmcQ/YjbR family) [Hasllibacter halocynthiae]